MSSPQMLKADMIPIVRDDPILTVRELGWVFAVVLFNFIAQAYYAKTFDNFPKMFRQIFYLPRNVL